MEIIDQIKELSKTVPAEIKEHRGIYELSFIVAERKVYLSSPKTILQASGS
jgi:hypothetical protein